MNKSLSKMRFGAVFILFLLLAVSVCATVTINNTSMSTDDSDLELNYLDGWVNAWNMTVDNESVDAGVINQWTLGYEHRGDAFFNASDAFDFTWAITSSWNSSVSNPFDQELNTTSDVTFNSVSGDGSGLSGVLLDWTDGDPFHNLTDSADSAFGWDLTAQWNVSDNNVTKIGNSNGNYWAVTEANLNTAINDVGTWGTVWIGSDITLTSEIDMDGHSGVTLDFMGNIITLSGDISCINFTACRYPTLRNVRIDVATQTVPIIKFYADSDANRVHYGMIANVHINNIGGQLSNYNGSGLWVYKEHNFTGIDFYGDGGTILEVLFQNVIIEGADRGIVFRATGSGWTNGCTFDHLYFDQFKDCCIEFMDDQANENTFYSLRSQTAVYSIYGLKAINGGGNRFNDVLMWDWSVATDGIYAYWVDTGAADTYIYDHSYTMSAYILDDGLGSTIKCGSKTLQYDADYDYKLSTDGTYYYVRLGLYGEMPALGDFDRGTDFQDFMYLILDTDDITVKLESGTFIPDQFINIRAKNITIEGESDHTTIIKCKDATQYAAGLFIADGDGDSNITFRNIVFDGSGASDSSYGLRFADVSSTHGLTVDNCIFTHWTAGTSAAILCKPSSDDTVSKVQITDNEFYYCDYAIHLDGDADPSIIEYVDISHNYFQECQYGIFCDYVFNSSFSNNDIISGRSASDGIVLGNSIDNIIDGNNVIVISDGIIESGDADYNMIYGNNFRHCGNPTTIIGANTNCTLNIV